MEQLKMYWLPGTPIEQYTLPEGYSISMYKTDADKKAWCDCCRHGSLIADDADDNEEFYNKISGRKGIIPTEDVFFIDYNGEHIGTITAYVHDDDNTGDIHMVAIREDFRGKGLAKYLTTVALNHLADKGVKYVHLTTDEFRASAVKSYLSGGFLPVEYDTGMQERWEEMLDKCNIDSVMMLREDATEFKTIYRRASGTNK